MPLLVITLTGVVMSFDWANTLLFRLSGSPLPAVRARDGGHTLSSDTTFAQSINPNYEDLLAMAKSLNSAWRTITINVAASAVAPVSLVVDTGNGGQPQARTQYLLNRHTGAVLKTSRFADGNLGQRLRAFVRFGHTGEYGGVLGQLVDALASLAACVLVYTGLALAIRRFAATLRAKQRATTAKSALYKEEPVA
jgi:uncharacterized iron-regulated membrane protein